jgi:GAF domain-containing protein
VAGEYALIERDWNDGSIPSNAGRHRLDDFGAPFIADLTRGRTIVIGDARSDPRMSSARALATFEPISIGAFLNVPSIKDGRLDSVLVVHSRQARSWSSAEIALAQEVAERT